MPIVGLIAVARGDGLTREQLIEIIGIAEEDAYDVLTACGEYLAGGEEDSPYRIYHGSFREFLLTDKKYTVYPAERHADIARYCEDKCGINWATSKDEYALMHTPQPLVRGSSDFENKARAAHTASREAGPRLWVPARVREAHREHPDRQGQTASRRRCRCPEPRGRYGYRGSSR
jgi:hypothetical protein